MGSAILCHSIITTFMKFLICRLHLTENFSSLPQNTIPDSWRFYAMVSRKKNRISSRLYGSAQSEKKQKNVKTMQDIFFAYINSSRNRFSEWAVDVRYRNFYTWHLAHLEIPYFYAPCLLIGLQIIFYPRLLEFQP